MTGRPARHRLAAVAVAAAVVLVGGCDDGSRAGSPSTSSTSAAPTTVAAATSTSSSATTPSQPQLPASFVATGPISTTTRIGPAAGGPLDGIDRDAGVSVALRDGSTLWLFGDTAKADADGHLTYFVIGTAAWAPAGSPAITTDYSNGGEPIAFATPTAGFPPCPADAPVPGMWPSSAVVQQAGNLDRVIVWMENICLGSSIRGAARGMAVAEWFYDPAAPPSGAPIQAQIINQSLFPQRSFGLASVLDGEGNAIVYSCDAPEQGGTPDRYGPCRAARVPLGMAANPAAYQVWDGTSWNQNSQAAQPMLLGNGAAASYPAGSFSITLDPMLHQYVMVYSPWPGSSDTMQIRTSAGPTGPWSAPTSIALPGCSDAVGTATFWCYAASAQPVFSEAGRLGVGYYDRHVSSNPTRGSYLVATIPYAPTPG